MADDIGHNKRNTRPPTQRRKVLFGGRSRLLRMVALLSYRLAQRRAFLGGSTAF
jgi:hypothetical protein